jgi:SnoaL-like polyketide cyclase
MTKELLLTSYTQAWNDHDHVACAGCFTSHATREMCLARGCGEDFGPSMPRGRDHIAAAIEAVMALIPDLAVDVVSLGYASDRRLWTEWRLRGTHGGDPARCKGTGRRIEVLGVSVFRLSNGGFTEERTYWDSAFTRGRRDGLPGLRLRGA